jgi:hypothetical protein
MGKKIFVSYKYADTDVCPLYYNQPAKVRDYVDIIEKYLDKTDNIYKGESAKEDLSDLSEEAIWERLKDRIYDSTVTIVLISPNMKESHRRDSSQWIPWEISYSLKEIQRTDRISRSNAVFAIVLPDHNNSYGYFIKDYSCCSVGCASCNTNMLFNILKKNIFNQKRKQIAQVCYNGAKIYLGDTSYIQIVKWIDFTNNAQSVINKAIEIKNKIDEYDICKEV